MKQILYAFYTLTLIITSTSLISYPTMIDLTDDDPPFFSQEYDDNDTDTTQIQVLSMNRSIPIME